MAGESFTLGEDPGGLSRPLQQEEKMKKPPLLTAALAGVGVSSYLEPVSYDRQRVSHSPSSAGVMWKENIPRFRTRAVTFLGNSQNG